MKKVPINIINHCYTQAGIKHFNNKTCKKYPNGLKDKTERRNDVSSKIQMPGSKLTTTQDLIVHLLTDMSEKQLPAT